MDIRNILIIELQIFPRSVEVAKATEKPDEAKKGWKRMLGRASTIAGSVKDILGDNPYVKGGLTLLGELLELFGAGK